MDGGSIGCGADAKGVAFQKRLSAAAADSASEDAAASGGAGRGLCLSLGEASHSSSGFTAAPVWSLLDRRVPDKGVKVVFRGGAPCSAEQQGGSSSSSSDSDNSGRRLEVRVQCDPMAEDGSSVLLDVSEPDACSFRMTVKSNAGCPREVSLVTEAHGVMQKATKGVFSTICVDQQCAGYPMSGVVDICHWPAKGQPILLMSRLDANTKNLETQNRATLTVALNCSFNAFDYRCPRVSLLGKAEAIAETDVPDATAAFLRCHPQVKPWLQRGAMQKKHDFHLYTLYPDIIHAISKNSAEWLHKKEYMRGLVEADDAQAD
jgi:hypothetical protein